MKTVFTKPEKKIYQLAQEVITTFNKEVKRGDSYCQDCHEPYCNNCPIGHDEYWIENIGNIAKGIIRDGYFGAELRLKITNNTVVLHGITMSRTHQILILNLSTQTLTTIHDGLRNSGQGLIHDLILSQCPTWNNINRNIKSWNLQEYRTSRPDFGPVSCLLEGKWDNRPVCLAEFNYQRQLAHCKAVNKLRKQAGLPAIKGLLYNMEDSYYYVLDQYSNEEKVNPFSDLLTGIGYKRLSAIGATIPAAPKMEY